MRKKQRSISIDGEKQLDSQNVALEFETAVQGLLQAHPGESGARLLPDGLEAFAVRTHSARLARHSLDVQTYIWHDDATGRYIVRELVRAADRGVHVRVLLDDMDARPRDVTLATLDRHRRIEVRMFNPFRTRSGFLRTLAELSQRGSRLNHRMHNKAWIADAQLAIVGGRNIGDEYFAANTELNFIDLDVLLLGPAVAQAQREFERYWNSSLSKPISRLGRYKRALLNTRRLRASLEASAKNAASAGFGAAIDAQNGSQSLLGPGFIWSANVRVVADDPQKALAGEHREASKVLETMVAEIQATTRRLLMVSPYFVPGIGGTVALRRLAREGAEVAILTNSLSATDVAAVHSGYARYRIPLLEGGVRLFEMKLAPVFEDTHTRFRLGSSRGSLHTKAMVLDGERVFIGSYNIDPRSANLNCEMGVWIRSPSLARDLEEGFRSGVDPQRAYALSVKASRLTWIEQLHGLEIRHFREPNAGWWRRLITRVLEQLPIEAQL
ncbi:MAG: phospholipase D family protein [Steroidobacteraceae bacterium]